MSQIINDSRQRLLTAYSLRRVVCLYCLLRVVYCICQSQIIHDSSQPQLFICFGTDWRVFQVSSTLTESTSRSKQQAAEEFYRQLMDNAKSAVDIDPTAADDEPSLTSYIPASGDEESDQKITWLTNKIKITKTKLTEYNCILGLELACRKKRCFKEICVICKTSEDGYRCLECAVCTKKAANSTKEYVDLNTKKLNCKKDWLNFLIKLARLSLKYPLLKYSTMPLDKIKYYMKELNDLMKKNEESWKLYVAEYIIIFVTIVVTCVMTLIATVVRNYTL
jgi:hypothetical protein